MLSSGRRGFQMKLKWIAFALVVGASFVVLLGVGVRIYQEAPPIANEIVTPDGHLVISGADIQAGQNVWQSMGGMEIGSIWGHGSYVAPDWTADSLHRELVAILNEWAHQESATSYETLPSERQARCATGSTSMIRTNSYDAATSRVTISAERARAFAANAAYYADVFRNGRDEYAIPARDADRPDARAAARGVLLLVGLGRQHEPSRRYRHVHQQLAARAAHRQPAHRRSHRLDRRQHHRAAGRHRRHGMVARIAKGRGPLGEIPADDPLLAFDANAFAARGREVLLDRLRL